jgi:hypothetical protein
MQYHKDGVPPHEPWPNEYDEEDLDDYFREYTNKYAFQKGPPSPQKHRGVPPKKELPPLELRMKR